VELPDHALVTLGTPYTHAIIGDHLATSGVLADTSVPLHDAQAGRRQGQQGQHRREAVPNEQPVETVDRPVGALEAPQ
jgi:hypothetical protein